MGVIDGAEHDGFYDVISRVQLICYLSASVPA